MLSASVRSKLLTLQSTWEVSPKFLRAGSLNTGASSFDDVTCEIPDDVREFYSLTDGPILGCVVFHVLRDLDRYQALCADRQGGAESWLCLGKIADAPVFLSRASSTVWRMDFDAGLDFEYGDFDVFLNDWVFGPKYEQIVPGLPDRDPWFEILQEYDFV